MEIIQSHKTAPNPTYQSNITNSNDLQTREDEIEFHTQHQIADHLLGSPPRWTRRASRTTMNGAFPSFPLQHHRRFPSPTGRLEIIKESSKSLMRMVEDMSESSYELSLRDIVDEQQKVTKESRIDSNTKRKHNRKSKISRSESMESGVFLLKMFIPRSLGSKKTCPKVSPPKPSPERADNRDGLRRSTSDISWSIQRPFTSYFRVFSWSNDRKPRRRGCLF